MAEITDRHMRAALEAAGLGTWEWEHRTQRVAWSATYERFCGVEPGVLEETSDAFFERIHPDDREPVARALAEARRQRCDLQHEFRVVRPDGTVRRLSNHTHPVFDPGGEPISVIGISRDVTEQREEEALRTSEARYRALVSSLSPTIWSAAPDGKIVEDSPSWRAFTGQTFDEYRRFGWLDAVHRDDRDRVWQTWTRVLRDRTPCELEYRVRRGDGAFRDVLVHAVPIRRADGQVREWTGAITDITEPKQEKEAMAELHRELTQKQRLLEEVLQQVPAGVLVLNAASGLIDLVSKRFRALAGNEFAPGRRYADMIRGRVFTLDGMPCATEDLPVFRSMMKGDVIEGEELVFERSDGDRLVGTVNAAPLRDEAGTIRGAVATHRDVTQETRLTREITEERARLRTVMDAMPSGVVLFEAPSGRVLYTNRQAEATLRGSLRGLCEIAVLAQLDARRLDDTPVLPEQCPFVRAFRYGEVLPAVELLFELQPGVRLYLRNSAAPIFDASGRISAAVWVFEDIGREVEARMEEIRTNRFRDLFVGMLGHDLRNPLAAMLMGGRVLARRGTLAPEDASLAARIVSSGERMARMIDQILDVTRIRLGGGIRVAPVPTDLHALVRRIAEECQAAHPGRAVHVRTSGDPAGVWDPDRLAQVVSNLVGNALQHTPAETLVDVSVERVDGLARLQVHNGGEPIPAEILPVLLDPFRRAERLQGTDGLGLGLYISGQIVASHGGKIEVTSSREEGTTFVVTLPVVAAAPPG